MSQPPFKVISLYPFTSDIEDDLHFEANQEIQVDTIEDEDWYSGSYTGPDGIVNSGMFPRNFVKLLEPVPLPDVLIPTRPALKKVENDTAAKLATKEPELDNVGNEEHQTADRSATEGFGGNDVDGEQHVEHTAKSDHKNGLLGRISTFNHETSSPLSPDSKPKEESFIKKPFHPAQSSYIPPSYGKSTVKKAEPANVPPPINSSSGHTVTDEHSPTEEEGPKMSLKERIALLQKRQQEEAEREAELEKRRQEKKELKKKKKAELLFHSDAEDSQEHPPRPITSNTTGGSLLSASSHGVASSLDPLQDENNSIYHDPEVLERRKTGGSEVKSVVEEESDDDNEYHDNKDERDLSDKEQEEEEEDDNDDDEDDDEDEEDEEEARKRALRERMAKLSGGVGMFGMMGMASPFAAAPSAKPKKTKTESKELEPSEALPPPQPLPGLSIPPLPKVADLNNNEDAPLTAYLKPEIPGAHEDLETAKKSDDSSEEDLEEKYAGATDVTDAEEDTIYEESLVPQIPPLPQSTQLIPKAEIKDHSVETEDQSDEEDSDAFEVSQTLQESSLPGDPLSSVIEQNTGYDADEDTDLPSSLPPVSHAPEVPTRSIPPPIPHTQAPPPVPHTQAPPPIPHTEAPTTRAPPIPPSTDTPVVPLHLPAAPPPVPLVPAHHPATLDDNEDTDLPSPPPIPIVPAPLSKAQSKTFSGASTSHHDNIAPVRRSSTLRDKEAPPPPPLSSISPSTTKKSLDLSRRSVEAIRRSSTLNSEVGHVNIDLSTDDEWWVKSELPPSIASEIGKNAIFEVDTHTIEKRGGRTVVYRDYYVLYHDLAQSVIEVNYSASDPANTVSFKQYEIKPPIPRKDKLDKLSFEYGSQVLKVAESLGVTNVGANRLVPYIFGVLTKRSPILPAIGTKGYGALVFKYNSAEDSTKYDEIRPGDILCLKAKFYVHNKLRQKTTVDIGVGEAHSCVIYEYEPLKQKFKVIETDPAGKITRGSYKLGDFKSGKLRVFRVVGKDYVNWN